MRKTLSIAILAAGIATAQQQPPAAAAQQPAPQQQPAGMPPSPLPPAQQPPGPPLSLADATALALKNHPQIAAAKDIAANAVQMITESKSSYYPTIDGEITGVQGLGSARLGAGALSASQLFNRFGQGLQLSDLLTDFGRRKSLVDQAKFNAQAADQNTAATTYDVVLGVNRAYFGVLEAKAYVTVADETIKARQTLTDQVTALANANLKSQYDVSAIDVNLSEAKLLLIRSQDAVERAYSALTQALGLDQVSHYDLAAVAVPSAPPDSPAALIAQAVQNRPELRGMQFRLQGAQAFEQAEADLKRPSISFYAVGGGLPYLDQTPRVAPYGYEGAALNVDIPIFNGHLFSAREQAAHYNTLAVTENIRNLRQAVENDVRNAWTEASTAYQRIPVTQQLLNQANLALELANGRYNLGLASIVDVTQAQLNLTQAQIENVTATYDYQVAYAQLQYTIGALR
ncbi:MAG TPA: TolC family protein [Bryobacteraceae bacterium]|nr:TolC family protein [Bryobacteraceae bacterium]